MKNVRDVNLTYIKRAPNLSDVSPYVGVCWQIYGRVTGVLPFHDIQYRCTFYDLKVVNEIRLRIPLQQCFMMNRF